MPKCTFSGKDIPKGQGIMYVRKNGQILWFLNSKCELNFLKLKRKPVNYKWSTHYKKEGASKADKSAEVSQAKPKATKPVAKKESKAGSKVAKPAAKKEAPLNKVKTKQ
jgi:large subunit ribosomal protein L24e